VRSATICGVSAQPQIPDPHTIVLAATEVAALLSDRGLDRVMAELAEDLVEDFCRWEEFDKTARTAAHSPDGVIELMPVADRETFTFKYVNGHPKNTALGLSTVLSFGVLADVATGMPVMLADLTLMTAVRTAVVSAVAARALARSDSSVMALIGNGAQSEFQAIAFHQLLGIGEVRLFDTDPAATAKLAVNLANSPYTRDLRVVVCASARQAALGADIITTATADKTNAAILTADLVASGVHINGVGGDCPGKTEIPPSVLSQAAVFVEYEPQTRTEGDIQQMPPDFPVTPLWRVLAGHAPGRVDGDEITVFDSVGFALEDFTALRYLRDIAVDADAGQAVALVPRLADPKDLYALVAPAHVAV
jgi:ornithine cyclodeaminase